MTFVTLPNFLWCLTLYRSDVPLIPVCILNPARIQRTFEKSFKGSSLLYNEADEERGIHNEGDDSDLNENGFFCSSIIWLGMRYETPDELNTHESLGALISSCFENTLQLQDSFSQASNEETSCCCMPGYPTINGKYLPIIAVYNDNLPALFVFTVTWIILVSLQIVWALMWWIINIPVILFWMLFGMFMFQMKTIAVGSVWNIWCYVWTGSKRHNVKRRILTEILNEALLAEFICETLPQFVVQVYNCTLLGAWSGIAIFSASMSATIALNGN
jgi:hypothetical protein